MPPAKEMISGRTAVLISSLISEERMLSAFFEKLSMGHLLDGARLIGQVKAVIENFL
jgi:hypothetical protein